MMLQCYGAAVTWFYSVYMVFQCYNSVGLQTDRATTRGPIGPKKEVDHVLSCALLVA